MSKPAAITLNAVIAVVVCAFFIFVVWPSGGWFERTVTCLVIILAIGSFQVTIQHADDVVGEAKNQVKRQRYIEFLAREAADFYRLPYSPPIPPVVDKPPPVLPKSPVDPVTPPSGPQIITELEQLKKLQQSCLPKFAKKPLPSIPGLAIEPDSHFPHTKSNWIIIAHYEPPNNLICFNRAHLNRTFDERADTMLHEHIHAWLNLVTDHKGRTWASKQTKDCHDEYFEMACQLLGIQFNPQWREQD